MAEEAGSDRTDHPYLMPMRCDAQVFLEHRMDYEKLSRYIVRKAREGQKITFMQILVAAYVRAVSRNPEANRFIFNKCYYARNNCSVSYTVLKDPQDKDSNETTVRILFDLTDTLYDVRDRMNDAVEKSRWRNMFLPMPIRFLSIMICGL